MRRGGARRRDDQDRIFGLVFQIFHSKTNEVKIFALPRKSVWEEPGKMAGWGLPGGADLLDRLCC